MVFTRENSRGIRLTRNTRNTDPFKPRTDESLALCHPYLQSRCDVAGEEADSRGSRKSWKSDRVVFSSSKASNERA